MKTIYLNIFLVLTASLSLHAQYSFSESISPYANSYATTPEDLSFANDFNFGMTSDPFTVHGSPASPFAGLTPAEDWLTNLFGANYAISPQGYLDTPYGTQENGLKIPVGNGTRVLLLIIGLYATIIFIRKKQRFNSLLRFA